MIITILKSAAVLLVVFLSTRQGWAIASGQPPQLALFSPLGFGRLGMMALGGYTVLAGLLVLFPPTYWWGNFLLASGILLIIALQLQHHNLRGAAVEVPFLLLSLGLIWLRHPLAT